jgi:PHD/YefM family antitoxin component YafN of YafNO toxin-antitoxin module
MSYAWEVSAMATDLKEHVIKDIPLIDPRIEYCGTSKLRSFNTHNLGKLRKTLVIQDNDTPLAVLVDYDRYMTIQKRLQDALDTIEVLTKKDAANALQAGLKDIAEGRHSSLKDVDPDL